MQTQLKEWARTMGYNGPIPENLDSICNESTKFIWEQLVQNVQPKQRVQHIKANIILNRLRARPLEDQDDFLYKMREVEEYKKKGGLEERINVLKGNVQGKKRKVDQLAQICKMKDISVDFLKKKIKENEQKKYLLEGKQKQLETQHLQIQEALREVKSEPITSCNTKGIRESLEHCAEKITNSIKASLRTPTGESKRNEIVYSTMKKKKSDLNHSVATYLSLQEVRDQVEITRICNTEEKNKENIDNNVRELPKKTRRVLELPSIVIHESDERSFEKLGVQPLSPDNSSEFKSPLCPVSKPKNKPKKRESLGLLPNSCLDELDDKGDDFFLCGPDYSLPRSDCSSLLENSLMFSSKSQNVTKIPKTDQFQDKAVSAELRELLSRNNRVLISEILQQSIQNVMEEFTKGISVEDEPRKKLDEDDICKLELLHVQTELNIIQQKRVLKDLVVKIGRRKLQILSTVKTRENFTTIQEWLESNLKEISLDASLSAIKKQLNLCKVQIKEDEETEVVARILKTKNNIDKKLHLIKQFMGNLENAFKNIEKSKRSVQNRLYEIQMLQYDAKWMEPLLQGRILGEEIDCFEEFPLEFQRRCIATDQNIFYKDLCIDNYPQETTLNDKELKLLQDILETPFSTPEMILLKLIKAKMKMNLLKTLKPSNNAFIEQYRKKYSYEALLSQDSFLESALERLKSILYSAKAGKTLASVEVTRQAMQVYMESPLKDFISDERLFEGRNFQFYQNKLNRFL